MKGLKGLGDAADLASRSDYLSTSPPPRRLRSSENEECATPTLTSPEQRAEFLKKSMALTVRSVRSHLHILAVTSNLCARAKQGCVRASAWPGVAAGVLTSLGCCAHACVLCVCVCVCVCSWRMKQ